MDQNQFVSVLLGGIGGAFVAQGLQVWRDGALHRRRVRTSARVLRTEIVMNMGMVQTAVDLGAIRKETPITFRSDRFERHIDVLVGELSRDETATLLTFFDAMHSSAASIMKVIQEGKANAKDVAWLKDTWLPTADLCQVMMDFRGDRWWERVIRHDDWTEFEKQLKAFDKKFKV